MATGDLPPGISVLEEGPCSVPGGNDDEGRVIMQIIADIEPGASQAFHTRAPAKRMPPKVLLTWQMPAPVSS